MQVVTERRNVQSSGIVRKREFTVEIGAHIMKVLSNLYSNPIEAIVREYSSNMIDGHVALHKIRPEDDFLPARIRIPSRLSPVLEFEDNGIGMSYDTVWDIYASYGSSTKNGNNDEIGGFGLGSKTAFCYNAGNSWTIESRFEGMKYSFMACVGETGIPTLMDVGREPTDEHSGVTIKIPIRRDDFDSVAEAVRKFAPHFTMPLAVEGLDIPKIEYAFRGTHWGCLHSNSRTITVIMGNVPYEVDNYKIECPAFCKHTDVNLFADIGSVDIVPSRDSLQYTDRTIQAVHRLLQVAENELNAQMADQIAQCKTEWEVYTFFATHRIVQSLALSNCVWNDKPLAHWNLSMGITLTKEMLDAVYPGAQAVTYGHQKGRRGYKQNAITMLDKHIISNEAWLIIDDIGRGAISRLRTFLHSHSVDHRATLLTASMIPDADKVSICCGSIPRERIKYASELVGPALRKARIPRKETVYIWKDGIRSQRWTERVRIPSSDGTPRYYLPLHRDDNLLWSYTGHNIPSLLDVAESLGFGYGTLYGIKDTMVVSPNEWILFDGAIKDAFLARVRQQAETLAWSMNQQPDYNYLNFTKFGEADDPRIQFYITMTEKYSLYHNQSWFQYGQQLFPDLQAEITELIAVASKDMPSLHEFYLDLNRSYPMIRLCDTTELRNHREDVLQYLNIVYHAGS